MGRGASKPPSQRQLRVGEELRHALAWMIERGEVHEPAVQATPVTITEVRISPDLKNATAYVTPLGGGDATNVLEALNRAKSFLRHQLSKQVRLKYVPRLNFVEDETFDEASHIDSLLNDPFVKRDLEKDRNDDGEGS